MKEYKHISENYVSFETALLLKEKDFDEWCPTFYSIDKPSEGPFFDNKLGWYVHNKYDYAGRNIISAPTQQMTIEWLIQNHGKYCQVGLDYVLGWYIQIIDTKETMQVGDDTEMRIYHPEHDHGFQSYKEAAEAALKYCLTNLI